MRIIINNLLEGRASHRKEKIDFRSTAKEHFRYRDLFPCTKNNACHAETHRQSLINALRKHWNLLFGGVQMNSLPRKKGTRRRKRTIE